MDELIKEVSTKTGLSPDQSRAAAEAVINFLKARLPAPIAGQIDAALKGGNMGDIAKGLGGMLGKK